MEILMERDKIFFTHKMLFANTIRSMINTAGGWRKRDGIENEFDDVMSITMIIIHNAESIVDESKTDTDTNNNTDIGEEWRREMILIFDLLREDREDSREEDGVWWRKWTSENWIDAPSKILYEVRIVTRWMWSLLFSYNRALPTGKMHREPYEWTGKGVVWYLILTVSSLCFVCDLPYSPACHTQAYRTSKLSLLNITKLYSYRVSERR